MKKAARSPKKISEKIEQLALRVVVVSPRDTTYLIV